MLNVVSKAAAGALRAVKPTLLQNEVARISGALSVNSEYKKNYLLSFINIHFYSDHNTVLHGIVFYLLLMILVIHYYFM